MRFVASMVVLAAGLDAAAAPAPPLLPVAVVADRSALLPSLRVAPDPAALAAGSESEPPAASAESGLPSHRRYVLPVVLSALVPGAGEIAAGHAWRGLPLVAADVATWLGYAHFRREGRDWRTRYEQFADAHWNYDLFGDTNGNGDPDPGEVWGWHQNLERYYDYPDSPPNPLDWWNPSAPYMCNCPYVPREEDRQHYYENIGKYNYYWMGWDDWRYNAADPGNSDSQAHRHEYTRMRIESNDNFDDSTKLIVVGMATRLASVVQSVLLVRSDQRGAHEFSMRPAMFPGRGAGLALRLKY